MKLRTTLSLLLNVTVLLATMFASAQVGGTARLGDRASVLDSTANAFGHAIGGLDRERELLFFVGNSFFNQNWVTAPASTTARDGLGPLFNTRSCASCHFKDGRGRPPLPGDASPTGFLIRLAGPEGGPDPGYGGQLQDHAIAGVAAEGRVVISRTERTGRYPDGSPYVLEVPHYDLAELAYGPLSLATIIGPRVANQMIGLGLLEAIPEADIVAVADPDDADGDGISGRANRVPDLITGDMSLGRFGWKASEPSIAQQVATAFLSDLGITTPIHPRQNCSASQQACRQAIGGENEGSGLEIDPDDFSKVVLYASVLAVPVQRAADDPAVLAGERLFREIGCTACHTEHFVTGEHPITPLSGQSIRPYTDLLLHDMGGELADGMPVFGASGREWRTPPLWGIGLFETVNDHTRYLHDGRARNLEEAILWHGGEAEAARDRFMNLPLRQREQLLTFLSSL
ncbi:MAG: hypothetical protein OXM87_02020 [Truepera sp.]|nr:hypothetical protein [Truepera sp.]